MKSKYIRTKDNLLGIIIGRSKDEFRVKLSNGITRIVLKNDLEFISPYSLNESQIWQIISGEKSILNFCDDLFLVQNYTTKAKVYVEAEVLDEYIEGVSDELYPIYEKAITMLCDDNVIIFKSALPYHEDFDD